MLERLVIAGSGGQGVILIGRLLATAAIKHFPYVTFFPTYGAEVRGGTSSCQVILSSGEIASPVAEEFDSMIILNQLSADKFMRRKPRSCLAVINSSMCRVTSNHTTFGFKASDLANDLGDVCVANFILLGAYLARKPVVDPDDVEASTRDLLGDRHREMIELNLRAFRLGLTQ